VSTRRGETLVRKEEAAVSSEEEKNKALVRRFLEADAQGDLDALEELMSPHFVDHRLLPGQEPGREGYIRAIAEQHASFSNIRYIVEDQAADGDRVISRLTIRKSHDRGEFAGFAPTGAEMIVTAIIIHRIVGGKIAEKWTEASDLTSLTQRRLEQEMRGRERVEQELHVAHRIQQASLPRAVPKLEGWQITHYYQPAREVGGDFYDFLELEDGRLGLVVGDATGKGVPAALVMATTCGMLRAVAQSEDYSPGAVLERVNEALCPNIAANMFVTCFYALLDPESGGLLYANAGHNLPCCRHNEHAARELRARGMPLGLMSGMSYEEGEASLRQEDKVLFYSDGLVEAHDPKGEMFGFPRLRALLAEHTEEERPLGEFLMEELYSFVGEVWEQEDDITLLTLERSPIRT
jgi:serine phosphatase RsbU (regulator of sigma subunit)/ketosteroid isomerase-like protein